MGAEVSFDVLRVGFEVVDPCVVTLFLRGRLLLAAPLAQQDVLDPGQPCFDSAQAADDGVILLRHLRRGGRPRDCCGVAFGLTR